MVPKGDLLDYVFKLMLKSLTILIEKLTQLVQYKGISTLGFAWECISHRMETNTALLRNHNLFQIKVLQLNRKLPPMLQQFL